MENKLAITMVALMVVALAAPAVMAFDPYTATVVSSQSTTVAVGAGGVAFSDMLVSAEKTLTNSLNLTNSGGWPAAVTAEFITNVSPNYGLVSDGNVLLGENFCLGKTGYLVELNKVVGAVDLTADNNIAAGATDVSYDAKLTVPGSQTEGVYSGTVELAFTNA